MILEIPLYNTNLDDVQNRPLDYSPKINRRQSSELPASSIHFQKICGIVSHCSEFFPYGIPYPEDLIIPPDLAASLVRTEGAGGLLLTGPIALMKSTPPVSPSSKESHSRKCEEESLASELLLEIFEITDRLVFSLFRLTSEVWGSVVG